MPVFAPHPLLFISPSKVFPFLSLGPGLDVALRRDKRRCGGPVAPATDSKTPSSRTFMASVENVRSRIYCSTTYRTCSGTVKKCQEAHLHLDLERPTLDKWWRCLSDSDFSQSREQSGLAAPIVCFSGAEHILRLPSLPTPPRHSTILESERVLLNEQW